MIVLISAHGKSLLINQQQWSEKRTEQSVYIVDNFTQFSINND